MEVVENLVITTSCAAALWRKGANVFLPKQVSVLDGLVINNWLCFLLSIAGVALPQACYKVFRYDNHPPCLHYSCVIVPAIFYFNSNEKNNFNAITSVSISLFFLLVLVCCRLAQTSKALYVTSAFATVTGIVYFINLFEHLFSRVCIFLFSVTICGVGCPRSFYTTDVIVIGHLVSTMSDYFFVLPSIKDSNSLFEMVILEGCLTALFIAVVVVCFIFFKEPKSRANCFYSVAAAIAGFYLQNILSFFLQLFHFFKENNPYRIVLILHWIFMAGISYKISDHMKANAVSYERKIFHFFLILIYIPALLYDVPLLLLSTVSVCSLLVVTISIISYEIEPLSHLAKERLLKFTGKPEPPVGRLLTPVLFLMGISLPTINIAPVYLLFGLSMPVWFSCMQHPFLLNSVRAIPPLHCFSGVLAVGIGEAFSCYVEANYGYYKFTDTAKSIQGVVSNILSQLILISIFRYVGCVSITFHWYYIIYVVVTVSLIEACTNQTTSLILPSFMYFLLI